MEQDMNFVKERYELCAERIKEIAKVQEVPEKYRDYFKSEAEAAAKRGIRFYSMTNTGGVTWDFGVIPYEPFPYRRNADSGRRSDTL